MTGNNNIAKTFNSYFESIKDPIELFDWPLQPNIFYGRMQSIVQTFSNHPSIIKIKQKIKLSKKFSFQYVSEATAWKVVKNMPSDKAAAGEIPVKVLKISEICFFELTNCINETIKKFPEHKTIWYSTGVQNIWP